MMPHQLFTYVSEELTASFIRAVQEEYSTQKNMCIMFKKYMLSEDWCTQLLVGDLWLCIGGRE
jgi:hypothetical protein